MGGSEKGGEYSVSTRGAKRLPSARRFRPGLPATVFTAFFLPLLLVLGAWQLGRAEEKRQLFEDFAAGSAAPVALAGGLDGQARYTRVEAAGRYATSTQFLLDNMVEEQQAGYRVLTPLLLDDGRTVLVDRGWIPKPFAAPLPDLAVDEAPRVVTGRLDRLPRPGIELEGAEAQGWPRVVQFPSLDELSRALGRDLVPGLVLLDAEAPDGFVRNWRPSDFGPERHLGYAVQWFALAGTLVVLYLAWSFRKTD